MKNENAQLIIGEWQAISWLVDNQMSDYQVSSTSFTFDEKGDYTFNYDGTKTAGDFKVEHDMLFTTVEGQQEIMVKIAKLNQDTLVFDMNRGGQNELMTLVRKK